MNQLIAVPVRVTKRIGKGNEALHTIGSGKCEINNPGHRRRAEHEQMALFKPAHNKIDPHAARIKEAVPKSGSANVSRKAVPKITKGGRTPFTN